jgi:nucleotide-binding universal stress UspA family protein
MTSLPVALRRPRGAAHGRMDAADLPRGVGGILLATEGRPISRAAIELAVRLAKASDVPVHVLAIARIWGTTFGFPNPGLYPTKAEWDAQEKSITKTVRRLERLGVEADGRAIGTRAGAKRILREAQRLGCEAIVMGADAPRNRLLGSFAWSQEPQRVSRAARIPVHLVPDDD